MPLPTSPERLRNAAIGILALLVWREARGQPFSGKVAVAYTVQNRADSKKWWGKDLLEVIGKKWQFSSMTDPKDKQLTFWPLDTQEWAECVEAANLAAAKSVPDPSLGATAYYDDSIPPPKWADPNKFTVKIGRIFFFKLDN